MTIQTIDLGTVANDGTGDAPRTAGQKINDNFTNATHAASRDVGTSAGQLMEVGAGGLLGSASVENLTAPFAGGRLYQAVSGSPISGLTVFGMQAATTDGTTAARFMGRGDRAFYEGVGGGGTGTKELYHSGNLNPNVFGGSAANRIVTFGVANSSVQALFELENYYSNAASSITVNSTFSVFRFGSVLVASGVTPTFFIGSKKACFVEVAGLTGLAVGENLQLRTDSSASTITVNS